MTAAAGRDWLALVMAGFNVLTDIGPTVIAGVITILLVDEVRKVFTRGPKDQFILAPAQTTSRSPLEAGEPARSIFQSL